MRPFRAVWGALVAVVRFLTVVNAREHASMLTRRRLLQMGLVVAMGVPLTLLLVRAGFSPDDAQNTVTLGLVGFCFAVKAAAAARLTVAWTDLAKSMTAVATLMALAYWGGILRQFEATVAWWPREAQWVVRYDLIFWQVVFFDAVVSRFWSLRHAALRWPSALDDLHGVAAGLRSGVFAAEEAANLIEEAATRLTVPEGRP